MRVGHASEDLLFQVYPEYRTVSFLLPFAAQEQSRSRCASRGYDRTDGAAWCIRNRYALSLLYLSHTIRAPDVALARKLAAARGRMIYCAVWGASDRWM